MAETNAVMGLATIFIGVAIMLALGPTILGSVSNGLSCKNVGNQSAPYDGDDGTGSGTANDGIVNGSEVWTGWKKVCNDVRTQSESAFSLFVIVLIVVSAVAVLAVVRML